MEGRDFSAELFGAPEGRDFGDELFGPAPKESVFRQVADVPLGVARGAVQGVRMIADAFGAGSDTSKVIKGAEDYLGGLMSAAAKKDQAEIQRLMKDAEDKGVLEQVKAGFQAFATAPVDMLSQAFGTAVPVILATVGSSLLGAGAGVATGVSALAGAGMGAGVVKGSIYDATKQALIEAGAKPEEAEKRAQLAQEYGGKNLDQILLGTVLGGVAAVGPIEKGAAGVLARRILGKVSGEEVAETTAEQAAKGALRRRAEAAGLEAVPEAVQAGQEQAAQNIALQREGFEVPTMRGVAGAATLEGLAGAGLGAVAGGRGPEVRPPVEPEVEPPAPEAPPAPPVVEEELQQLTSQQKQELERQRALTERPKTTEELIAETGIQTGQLTTAEDVTRIRDEHETAVIEGLLAQDAEMQRANELAAQQREQQRRNLEFESEAETIAGGISEVDQRVREGRIMARVQDLIDRNIPFASTAITDINNKLSVINEAPLSNEERNRIQNIMGMVNVFTGFVNLPQLAPRPVDTRAENQAMEALIKERKDRGPTEPLRATPVAPSPRVEEAPVSQGVGEGAALRPEGGIEPSAAQDRQLVTSAPVAPVSPVEPAPVVEAAAPTAPVAEAPAPVAEALKAEPTTLTTQIGGSDTTLDLGKPVWQATDEDLVQAVKDSGAYLGKPGSKYDPYMAWREAHTKAIQQAKREGKTFPPEVLYDKPKLIRDDLSDSQADEAIDVMVDVYRATKDYGKAVEAYRNFGKKPKAEAPAAPAKLAAPEVHEDQGVVEPATPEVIEEAADKGKQNTNLSPAEMRKNLTDQIDRAIASAPETDDADITVGKMITSRGKKEVTVSRVFDTGTVDIKARELRDGVYTVEASKFEGGMGGRKVIKLDNIGGPPASIIDQLTELARRAQPDATVAEGDYVTFEVPGDGTFKVLNNKSRLAEFRKKVESNPGFKAPKKPAPSTAPIASASKAAAIKDMIDGGDPQAAVDYAAATGVDINDLLKNDRVRRNAISGLKPTPEAETKETQKDITPAQGAEQRNNFFKDLRQLLNKFGLKDVALKIEQDMQEAGTYARELIRIADRADNPIRTLRHEAIHALRELGFFTDAQWKSLSKMAKDKWIDQYLKQRNVDGKPLKAGEESRYDAYMREYDGDMEKITEEAVADAFADFDATKPPAGLLQTLLRRLRDFFQAMKSALTKVESPEQIFGKVEKGELKPGEKRQSGERKSVRDRATANFLRWFGDSKVVDKKGEPLVVYHGTGADIDVFRGKRIYFAEKPEYASTFAGQYLDEYRRPNIIPAYLSIKKPLDLTSLGGNFVSTSDIVSALESSGAMNTAQAVKDRQFEKYGRKQGINVWELWFESPIFEAAKDDGFDGVIQIEQAAKSPDEMHDSRVFIAFRPEQIKSAIGNNGEYSLTNADIRKSLGGIRAKAAKAKEDIIAAGREAGQKRKLDKGAFEGVNEDLFEKLKPVFAPRNVTIQDRIIDMRDNFWQRVAQGMADQFRTIKEYSYDAYMKARLSKSIDGGLEGLMFHGQVFNDGGALNIKKNTRGMFDVLKPVGKELDRYLIYIALSRDAALPEGKRSIDPDLVARRGELIDGTLNGKPRKEVYEQVRKDMNLLNRSVLKVAVDSGLLNTTEGAIKDIEANENLTDEQKREKIAELRKNPIGYERFINDLNYIPFYKIMEDGDTDAVAKAVSASGLTSQYFSKALKGGEKPFGDLMENTLKNWSHILSASMKNQAAVAAMDAAVKAGVAVPNLKPQYDFVDGKVVFRKNGEVVGDGSIRADMTESEKGAVKIVVDGKNTYYNVSDPLLMDSITSIGFLGTQSKFLDVARDFKNLLQYGVTISPQFRVNNLIRDAVGAMGVSELRLNPVANVLQGVSLSDRSSPTYIAAMAGGGIFNFGTAYEGDQSKMIKRLLKMGVDRDHILDSDSKIATGLKYAWDKYQEWGNKAENANRLALYQQLRDKGMSHLEASFKARDLMDFSMQGSWPAFRALTQVIPFLNARVQGLYKLGRDGISPTARVINNTITGKPIEASDKQKAQQFSIVLMGVTLASALLYLTFKDDEEYKRRDDWDKDNFWWFRVPGMEFALRVPKPFEIGAFGTVVERTLEQILDSGAEGKEFGDALFRMLTNTFAINPIPQAFKPLVDIYANKDSFTGAPIESAGLERLSKQERMVDTTSPLAIALGKVSSLFPETFEISPVQADYLIKGYLGWLGGTIAATSTYATMPFKEGEYPDARWMDRLSLGLARELPGRGAKFVTAFYESNKEIAQAYADMRHYAAIGDSQKVQELLEEKGDKIRLAKFYDNVATQMANIRKQIRLTQNDKLMDGAAKKEAIDRMQDMIAMLAKQAEDIRKQQKGGRP